MSNDLIYALGLWGLAAAVALVYVVRVRIRGRARAARIDQQGGSALFNKKVMEGGFWFVEPFGKLLVFFGVTANQVSLASLFFGFVAGACIAVGHFGSGACFATLSAVLDLIDGIVARLSGTSSDAGEVMDAAVDRYVEFFFIGGLVIYYREIPVLMGLAMLAFLGAFQVSYSTAKAEALNVPAPRSNMRRPERALYLILGAALSPITIPMFEQVREFSIPMAHPMIVAMGFVAVLSNVSAVERFVAIAKSVRKRDAELAAAKAPMDEEHAAETPVRTR